MCIRDRLDTATVTITVTAVNDAPVASADTVTTNEDTDYSGILSASDVDGDSLTYIILTNPSNGNATITNSSSGAYTYSPTANYNGSDSFMFTASDSSLSDTATITINVLTIDDLPVVVNALVDITVNEDAQDTVVADLDMVFMDVDEELEYSHIIEDTALVFASVTNDSVSYTHLTLPTNREV